MEVLKYYVTGIIFSLYISEHSPVSYWSNQVFYPRCDSSSLWEFSVHALGHNLGKE